MADLLCARKELMASYPYTFAEYNHQNAFQNLVCNFNWNNSPYTFGIQCLLENEETAKYSGSCIQLT